jgi:hypothetical protein
MVKHVILWKLKDMSEAEYATVISEMKTNLEALVGKVPGLLDLKVYTTKLPSSNVDVMLDSTLESEEALKGYAVHPDHVFAADTYVRPFTASRSCLDFEI